MYLFSMKSRFKITTFLFVFLSVSFGVKSQIVWPEGQLLPTFPASNQTQDLIFLQNNEDAEMYLFASLKGIVNQSQPRIFSYEGDAFAEGAYTWLNSLKVKYREISKTNTWSVLQKYLPEVSGLIVYDPEEIHTVNLATTLALNKKAVVASPSLLSKLTSPPYNLAILEDLRGKFANKLEVYQTLYDDYWPNLDHRLLIGLNPEAHKAALREYATALGAAVVWLDPKVADESVLLNKFLASMPAGANYMGWWPEEQAGVDRVSRYGITTIASDYCSNLTFHSGMPRTIEAKPMLAKPELENKIYVAFILSDGDNLQYVEHLMRKLWNNADRGSVPIGWTISPAMVDAMPGALNFYHKTATNGDNLISGPSGYGYTYPNYWPATNSREALKGFVTTTEDYNVRAGIRVITIWNTITGGITKNAGDIFAANASTLLGLTTQNTGGALTIFKESLPSMPLSCNYCTGEQAMIEHINSASKGWDGKSPRFVIIQAQPWKDVTPTTFKKVKNTLGANYSVVRPDQIFQLIREANGLSVNPGGIEGNGLGLRGVYYNGKNFETKAETKIDAGMDFNWGADSPAAGVEANNFSVRWTGEVQPRYTGTYSFYITSNNVSRLWINNELIIEKGTTYQGTFKDTISLKAGQKYKIKAEYIAGTTTSSYKLEWASALQSREVIPQSQLYDDTSLSGMKDVNVFSDLKLFVANGFLNVEMNNDVNKEVCLVIHDACGKALLRQNIREASRQLDVSHFSKGLYLISVDTKKYSKTIKYIIN